MELGSSNTSKDFIFGIEPEIQLPNLCDLCVNNVVIVHTAIVCVNEGLTKNLHKSCRFFPE